LWLEFCRQRWEDKQNIALTPQKIRGSRTSTETYKLKYMKAERDSQRTDITKEELVSFKWKFSFNGGSVHSYPKFKRDHTLVVYSREMRWKFTADRSIQVEPYPPLKVKAYPPLKVTRNSHDWSWQLTNNYVCFLSCENDEK